MGAEKSSLRKASISNFKSSIIGKDPRPTKGDERAYMDPSVEVKGLPSEIISMKQLLELEIDAKYFREKMKFLETAVGDLKVDNKFLQGQMTSLVEKVERFQDEKERENVEVGVCQTIVEWLS